MDMNVSKEWAELFLEKWNQAVRLWDNGKLFEPLTAKQRQEYRLVGESNYTPTQRSNQHKYAVLCCTWFIPNGMVEPHCVAEGR